MARALIVGPTRDRLGLSNLRATISFGGIVPLEVARFFNALGVTVWPLDDDAGISGPAKIKAALRGSVYIRDASVVRTQAGDWAALVSLDREAVASWAEARGNVVSSREHLGTLDDVPVLIGREIAAASRGQRDTVATFSIATPDFSVADQELSAQGELLRNDRQDQRR